MKLKIIKKFFLNQEIHLTKMGDSNGPPIYSQEKFSLEEDYNKSLENSVNFFLNLVFKKQKIHDIQYENSLLTNELIYKIKKSKL